MTDSRTHGPKARFHLLDAGDDISLADIVALFRSLTGRDPTPEELEEAKKVWDAP